MNRWPDVCSWIDLVTVTLSIQLHGGFWASRHLVVVAVTLCESTFRETPLSDVRVCDAVRSYAEKQKNKAGADRQKSSSVCVINSELLLSPWLTFLFSFPFSSCLL